MDYNHHIAGTVIRQLRNERGMSQELLSGLAGIARSHLSMIEAGSKQPNFETLWRIAGALEIRPSELVAAMEQTLDSKES